MHRNEVAAVIVYTLVSILVSAVWVLVNRHFRRSPPLLERPRDQSWVRRNTKASRVSLGAAVVLGLIGVVAPVAAFAGFIAVPIFVFALNATARGLG